MGWGERLASRMASDIIGQEVHLHGLSAGWFSPITIDALAIAPKNASDPAPLVLNGVYVPLTLLQARSMPLNLDGIRVTHVTLHVVRDEGGTINWLEIMDSAMGDGEESTEPESTEPASPIPVERLGIELDDVTIMYHDRATSPELLVGLDSMKLTAAWRAGTPITAAVSTTVYVNGETAPFELDATVDGLLDSNRTLTPMSAGGEIAGSFAGESFSATYDSRAGIATSEGALSIGYLARAAATILPPEMHTDANGALQWTLRVDGLDKQAGSIAFSLNTDDLETVTPPGASSPLPLPAITVAVGSKFNFGDEFPLSDFSATVNARGLAIEAMGNYQPTDESIAATLDALIDADEIATGLLPTFPRLPTQSPVSGQATLSATASGSLSGEVAFDAKMGWQGGELRWLAPLADVPQLGLDEGPLSLSPTTHSMAISGSYSAHRVTADYDVSGETLTLKGTASVDPRTPMESIAASFDAGVSVAPLAPIIRRFAEFPPGVPEDSRLALSLSTDADSARIAYSVETTLSGHDEILALRSSGEWSVADSRLGLEQLTLAAPFANLDAEGTIGLAGVSQLEWQAAIKLAESIVWASPFLSEPLGIAAAGRLDLQGTVEGALTEQAQVAMTMTTSDDYFVEASGFPAFSDPIAVDFAGAAAYAGGDLSLEIQNAEIAIGDAIAGGLGGTVNKSADQLDVALEAQVSTMHAAILAMARPFAPMPEGIEFAIDGESQVELSINGQMILGEEMRAPEMWEVNGTEVTFVDTLQVVMPGMRVDLLGASDEREFTAAFDPLDPTAFSYSDEAATIVEAFSVWQHLSQEGDQTEREFGDAPDVQLISLSLGNSATVEWPGQFTFTLLDGALEESNVEGAYGLILLPGAEFSGSVNADLKRSSITAQELRVSSPDFLEGNLDASFDMNNLIWGASGGIKLTNLSSIAGWLGPGEDNILLHLSGDASAQIDLAGTADIMPELGRLRLPAHGAASASWNEISLPLPGDVSIESLTGSVEAQLSPERLEAKWNSTIANVRTPVALANPISDWSAKGRILLDDLDTFTIENAEFGIDSLGLGGGLGFETSGFGQWILILAQPNFEGPPPPAEWWRALRFDANGTLFQDLDQWELPLAETTAGGRWRVDVTARSSPGQRIKTELITSVENLTVALGESIRLASANGRLPLAKSLLLSTDEVPAATGPRGTMIIRGLGLDWPPVQGSADSAVMHLSGFDQGTSAELLGSGFFGGTARATLDITEENGVPVISGEYQVTNVDARSVLPGLAKRKKKEIEVSGFGEFRWAFPLRTRQGRVLDNLSLTLQITEIARDVTVQLLRDMDPEGASPGIQATIAALRFSTPERASIEIRNGLLSLGIHLKTATGQSIPMPVFDRANIAQTAELYAPESVDLILEGVRLLLLFTLAQDMGDLQNMITPEDSP